MRLNEHAAVPDAGLDYCGLINPLYVQGRFQHWHRNQIDMILDPVNTTFSTSAVTTSTEMTSELTGPVIIMTTVGGTVDLK